MRHEIAVEASGDLPQVLTCGCPGEHHPREVFYTSARRDDGRAIALSGPYGTHDEALAMVDTDRRWAYDESGDPRAFWYAYGTFSTLPETAIRPVRR